MFGQMPIRYEQMHTILVSLFLEGTFLHIIGIEICVVNVLILASNRNFHSISKLGDKNQR